MQNFSFRNGIWRTGLARRLFVFSVTWLPLVVWADDIGMPAVVLKSYTSECAACHVAYAPGLLPAPAWNRLMNSLENHYGSDASIDEKSVKEISTWLQKHGASTRRFNEAPPDNRITSTAWFVRKHREIGSAVWTRTAVKSRANCVACHQRAAKGIFEEDEVRIPR
ncbi:MAG: diheme cytochrome c [Burkholderiales bacterium]|nr:diheme cytochrome c [Burkholderiales bacterium]